MSSEDACSETVDVRSDWRTLEKVREKERYWECNRTRERLRLRFSSPTDSPGLPWIFSRHVKKLIWKYVTHFKEWKHIYVRQNKPKAIWKIYTSKNVSINNYSVFICIHISNKLYRKCIHYYMKLSFYLHIFIVIKCHLPGFIINVFFILAMIFIA